MQAQLIAICFVSNYGQTRRISEFVAQRLETRGFLTKVIDVTEKDASVPEEAEVVVLAGPLYAGRYPKPLHHFVHRNSVAILSKTHAFCGVSLTHASHTEFEQNKVRPLICDFLKSHGLTPKWTLSVAGALNYREYGFFTRWMMKRISRKAGGPIDTTRNHELTDWNQLTNFADEIAEFLVPADQANISGTVS